MYALKRDKRDEEDGGSGNPFNNLEKTTVLQEARTFNETPLNTRKCANILTKMIYLLNQGEQLATVEATEAFFAMTKLFQSNDPTIRRLVYLCIKELAGIAEDVIIVTSSLTKDMTGKEEQYRPAAIRALCTITDGGMLQAIERYMKQAIVDKNSSVSSAALVSSLHMMKSTPDVVKRWVNEAQEAVNSDNVMVQYHALGLLYQIRKNDKLAISKLLTKYTRTTLKSPYAVCLLIRIASKLIEDDDAGLESPHFDFIESCLRHKSEMVIYEAAHAIVNMKSTTPRELAPAVSVLQLFCASSKPTLRFAAVKTLNKVAMTHPAAVTACNIDLENLITDSNRNIATLAITTLLKTGSESSVDRLMKQITSFMSEISDEFKVVVVQSIRSLCQKFPRKHNVMMNFLSGILRDEGGFEYKKAIVDTIINIIEDSPDGKEAGLAHLCEFIEDCEHTSLGVKVLYLLGKEGPKTSQPCKYIRYIYNRLILEKASVRAAAVSSLAKFGAHCEELLPNILVLLQRSLLDCDDEVRDRATYYLNILNQKQKGLYSQFILNGTSLLFIKFINKALKFIFTIVYKIVSDIFNLIFSDQLSAVPELSSLNLGPLFKSSLPIELTESETEFVVRCIKHTFTSHIVLQFDCTNTLSDQVLENVYVQVEPSEGFEVVCYSPCSRLQYSVPGTAYACISLPNDPLVVLGTLSNTLKYLVKDCDPNSGEPDDEEGYEDEYVLEELDIVLSDHIQKVLKTNFSAAWEEITAKNELEDTYAFNLKTLEDAVKNVLQFLGMQPCERSDKIPENKSSHVLFLSGVYRGGHMVLVRAKLAVRADTEGVTMNIAVRSSDPNVSEVIASAIG
nr:coatomer subunit gamma-2 [Parasteatoda tepidariorum]